MKKFLIDLLILSLILLAIVSAVNIWLVDSIHSEWTIAALAFFTGLTMLTYYIGNNALDKAQKTFTAAIYGSIGLRFIFSLFFIVIYLIINEVKDRVFIAEFLLLYLFYTMFEIYYLVTKLRSEK